MEVGQQLRFFNSKGHALGHSVIIYPNADKSNAGDEGLARTGQGMAYSLITPSLLKTASCAPQGLF